MDPVLPDASLCALERLVPFPEAWDWQRRWQQRLIQAQQPAHEGVPELLLLLEHPPCYTLGRGASEAHLHFDPRDPPAPLHRIDRGGEVTHHLPGQLVVYPVLDLQRHRPDLHWYLRQLEGVVLDVLQQQGLQGQRREGLTGVWLEGQKLAAIGVGARRWVTQHGLALNVSCDLAGFGAITPCGLRLPVGRLQQWRPQLSVADLRQLVAEAFCARFGWQAPQWISEQTLRSLAGSNG
ncbi:MAG: lipoyl(octanoyl) transferase LipB [Synechococcus sp.]|nr:lipoyl(octanoyl) transferase LipB [Synechococcus sp.]